MPCPVGRYCEGGTTLAEHCECEPGNYCPESSSQATGDPCPEVLIAAAAAAVSYVHVAPALSWSPCIHLMPPYTRAPVLTSLMVASTTVTSNSHANARASTARAWTWIRSHARARSASIATWAALIRLATYAQEVLREFVVIRGHPRAWKCSALIFGACRFLGCCYCYLRNLTSRCCQGTSVGVVHTSVPHARAPRATSVRKGIMALVRNQAKQSMQPY